MEPLVKLRVPLIFNLRRDPFERAQHNSNTYYDWMMSHAFMLYEMQAVVAAQIEDFVKFPPRQNPAVVQSRRGDAAGASPPPVGRRTSVDADAVSQRVQTFYERHPYPPPVDSLDKYRALSQDRQRRRADFHLVWPAQRYREDQSILIAGCGTSQAAKHALRWPAARITGIDFSAASVRHTEELKRRYGLDNLEVRQLPIERVGELGSTFDQIVCTGVLHHLPDPGAGLSALREVLRPDGAMHIMVYAPYGRTGIYMLQDFCRRVGIQATDEGIRELVAALAALAARTSAGDAAARGAGLPAGGGARRRAAAPARPRLFGAAAVRAARDDGTDLRPVGPAGAVRPALRPDGAPPARARIAALPAGRPVRRRRAVPRHHASPQRDRLPRRRPRRRAPAQLRRRRLAAIRADPAAGHDLRRGAAAAGRGRRPDQPNPHATRDIYLPIDAAREANVRRHRWQAHASERSPGPAGDLDASRAFFERLYRHDQIVFDASG